MIDDIAVYVLLDPEHAGGHALPDLAAAAAGNGASLLQLRHKKGSARDMIALTQACKAAAVGVPLVVNDRVDVAVAAGADGVHVGQSDIPAAVAREMLGPDAIVGLTIKTEEHLAQAPLHVVSYFGIGGVFATQTKDNPDAPIGLDGLSRLCRSARSKGFGGPLAAIAGISHDNAASVIAAGADGVCVVSAVSGADDPAAAVRDLAKIVQAARAARTPA